MSAPPIHRLGDPNSAGGIIDSIPQSSVFANDKLVAVDGSLGTGHPPWEYPHLPHTWLTSHGSRTVSAEGIPINRTGDSDTCGHPRAAGSSDVFVGD